MCSGVQQGAAQYKCCNCASHLLASGVLLMLAKLGCTQGETDSRGCGGEEIMVRAKRRQGMMNECPQRKTLKHGCCTLSRQLFQCKVTLHCHVLFTRVALMRYLETAFGGVRGCMRRVLRCAGYGTLLSDFVLQNKFEMRLSAVGCSCLVQ
jgi:hypothetical protein